jgi:rubrerythrin
MDILAFAIQMEKDGEQYYRSMSSQINNPGLKKILNMLADDELKHIDFIQNAIQAKYYELTDTTILDDAKNIFSQMDKTKDSALVNSKQTDLYQKAIDIEKKSEEFYKQKSSEVSEPSQKKLLEKLADEERKHSILLENLLDFIQEPLSYLENAEFSNL